jgi:DNA-binding NarL/FixJ family response regulator
VLGTAIEAQAPPRAAPRSVRVLVMGDEPLMRDCLSAALEARGPLAVAGTAASLVRWPSQVTDVEVVVADLGHARAEVPVIAHMLRDVTAGWPVLVLLDDPDGTFVPTVARIGIEGAVARRSPLDVVVRAIRTVAAGGVYVDPGLVCGDHQPERLADPLATLTSAERRVLALLHTGWSNRQIASALDRSVNTVKSQISSALRKLGVASRVEAALMFERLNPLSEAARS